MHPPFAVKLPDIYLIVYLTVDKSFFRGSVLVNDQHKQFCFDVHVTMYG